MASTRERNGRFTGLYRDAQGKQKSAGTYATEKEALKAAGHAEALANPAETVEAHSTTVRGRVTVAGYAPGWLSSQMLEETSRENYEELSIPVDEEFQAAAASSSSVAVGDVAFASGA